MKPTSTDAPRLRLAAAILWSLLLAACAGERPLESDSVSEPAVLCVGTQQNAESAGVIAVAIDGASRGTLAASVVGIDKPTFITSAPTPGLLVGVSEVGDAARETEGSVFTLACDDGRSPSRIVARARSGGSGPCALDVAPDGRWIAVANYGGGSVAIVPMGPGGALSEPTCVVRHAGHGPVPKRQDAPHVHDARFAPGGNFVFVVDLGLDRVLIYPFDGTTGRLDSAAARTFDAAPGSGPRRLAFSRDGRWVFIVNEIGNTVSSCAWDRVSGTLESVGSWSTLPEGEAMKSFAGDIVLSGDGRRLYVSNRGHDSIACFDVDEATGHLQLRSHTSSGGKFPWSLAIDLAGHSLFAANQGSNIVVEFELNPATGVPGAARRIADVTRPTSLVCR